MEHALIMKEMTSLTVTVNFHMTVGDAKLITVLMSVLAKMVPLVLKIILLAPEPNVNALKVLPEVLVSFLLVKMIYHVTAEHVTVKLASAMKKMELQNIMA